MSLRTELYELAAIHRLDTDATFRLQDLAGLHAEPPALPLWVKRGILTLAIVLGGCGIILSIAAHWDLLGRFGRFGLLQGLVVVTYAGALWRPTARAALGLVALLGTGWLLALFGETYQSTADAWQTFALWAALSLPLCLATRSDMLWTPWTLVTTLAITSLAYAHTGQRPDVRPLDMLIHALAWLAAVALTVAMSRMLHRYTGAGIWAFRSAATLAAMTITLTAVGGLFGDPVAPYYPPALVLMAGAAVWLSQRRVFDVYTFSVVIMGLCALLTGGLSYLLLDGNNLEPVAQAVLIALTAAILLVASLRGILLLTRFKRRQEAAA